MHRVVESRTLEPAVDLERNSFLAACRAADESLAAKQSTDHLDVAAHRLRGTIWAALEAHAAAYGSIHVRPREICDTTGSMSCDSRQGGY